MRIDTSIPNSSKKFLYLDVPYRYAYRHAKLDSPLVEKITHIALAILLIIPIVGHLIAFAEWSITDKVVKKLQPQPKPKFHVRTNYYLPQSVGANSTILRTNSPAMDDATFLQSLEHAQTDSAPLLQGDFLFVLLDRFPTSPRQDAMREAINNAMSSQLTSEYLFSRIKEMAPHEVGNLTQLLGDNILIIWSCLQKGFNPSNGKTGMDAARLRLREVFLALSPRQLESSRRGRIGALIDVAPEEAAECLSSDQLEIIAPFLRSQTLSKLLAGLSPEDPTFEEKLNVLSRDPRGNQQLELSLEMKRSQLRRRVAQSTHPL